MKYDERLKYIWKMADKEESRYAAVLIDVKAKCAVATDGHALAALGIADLIEPADKADFLVPIDAIRSADAFFAKQKRLTAKDRKLIYIRGTDDSVTVTVGASRRSVSFDEVSGVFPQWKGLAKAPGPKAINISTSLLLRLAEAMGGASIKRDDFVTLFIADGEGQITVGYGANQRQSYGLLMPARGGCDVPKRFWEESNGGKP